MKSADAALIGAGIGIAAQVVAAVVSGPPAIAPGMWCQWKANGSTVLVIDRPLPFFGRGWYVRSGTEAVLVGKAELAGCHR